LLHIDVCLMSDQSPEKLRVLVVDDDRQWLDTLQTQSRKLNRSKLEIEASHSFSEGLQFLKKNKEIDVVVVDYFLDHSHVGSDFINKAREMGRMVPYVIVSGAQSSDVVSDATKLDDLVQSAPTDFIEKMDIASFIIFQDRIFESHRKFREKVIATLATYFESQKASLQNMWVLGCELRLLHQTASSYLEKIDVPSFGNLSGAIRDDIERLLSYLNRSLDMIPDSSDFTRGRGLVQSAELSARSPNRLKVDDYVPYSKERDRLLALLRECEENLSDLSGSKASVFKNLVSSVFEQEEQGKQHIAEVVVLHLADRLAEQGQTESGVDLLYDLSQALARRRENARVASTDMLTAAFLYEHGKPQQAATYVSAAKKLAQRLSNSGMAETFHRLLPAL
jgi:CheY-like chemotaxis protein